MHPLINAKALTDDEIMAKIGVLTQRLAYARGMIGDVSMINNLNVILETYRSEYQERLAKQQYDAWQKQFPDVIESDPEFKKDAKATGAPGSPAKPTFTKKFGQSGKMPFDLTPVPVVKEDPKPKKSS
jgi:hypothetical protein